MGALVNLVAQGHRAGVQIGRAPDGSLLLRAPKPAAPLARQLRAREAEVLQLWDWRPAPVAEPAPCLLCGRPAILRDPVEHRPCHKVCIDPLLRPASAVRDA